MPGRGVPDPDPTQKLPLRPPTGGATERFGRFQLHERLGAGVSHGTWKAWEDAAARWVVLRVWDRPTKADREAVQWASSWAGVPGVVAPLGAGTDGGRLWMAREFLEGAALSALTWSEEGRFVRVARDASRILAAAHASGRCHGRVTAGNVIVAADGNVWLADAGLARGEAREDVVALARVFGELFGLPGDPKDPSTARGALAGHLSTTRLSEQGPLVAADARLAGILVRGRDGEMDAAAFSAALDGWLGGGRTVRGGSRKPLVAGGIAAAVLVAAILVGLVLRSRARARVDAVVADAVAAESEGRLEDADRLFDRALEANRGHARAREGKERIAPALEALRAERREAEARAEARSAALARLEEVTAALEIARGEARKSGATRARVDAALVPVFTALASILELCPDLPEALEPAWQAADLSDQGAGSAAAFARLPGAVSGMKAPPLWAWREEFRNWISLSMGVRGWWLPLRESVGAARALSLSRGIRPAVEPPDDPVRFSKPLLQRLAELEATLPENAPERAFTRAARALLDMDISRATHLAHAAAEGSGELTADAHLLLAILERPEGKTHVARGLALRPWDLGLLTLKSMSVSAEGSERIREQIGLADAVLALHPAAVDFRLNRAWWKIQLKDYAGARADVEPLVARTPQAQATRAQVRLIEEDFRGAIADARAVLERQPTNLLARSVICEALVALGEDEGLAAEGATLAMLDPQRAGTLAIRAAIRRQTGDRDGALQDCDAALALSPRNTRALLVRALLRTFREEQYTAIADIEMARVIGESPAEVQATLAFTLMVFRRVDEAEKAARASLEVEPGQPLAQAVLAWFAAEADDLDEALKLVTGALEKRPGLIEARYIRALVLTRLQRSAEAMADVDWLLNRMESQYLRYLKTEALLGTGRVEDALVETALMVRIWPDSAVSRYARSLARRAASDTHWEEDLDNALRLNPRLTPALEMKARALVARGLPEEAVKVLESAVAIEPESGDLRLMLGRVRRRAGDPAGAIKEATAALKLRPDLTSLALCDRAEALMEMSRLEEALADCDLAVKADRSNMEAWVLTGRVLAAKNEKAAAVAAYRKVLELGAPDEPLRAVVEKAIRELESGPK